MIPYRRANRNINHHDVSWWNRAPV